MIIIIIIIIILIFSVSQVELLASFALIVILTVYILIHSYNVKSNDPTNSILIANINDCTSTIIWYPIAMLVCYVPYSCYEFYIVAYMSAHGDNPLNALVSILLYYFKEFDNIYYYYYYYYYTNPHFIVRLSTTISRPLTASTVSSLPSSSTSRPRTQGTSGISSLLVRMILGIVVQVMIGTVVCIGIVQIYLRIVYLGIVVVY